MNDSISAAKKEKVPKAPKEPKEPKPKKEPKVKKEKDGLKQSKLSFKKSVSVQFYFNY